MSNALEQAAPIILALAALVTAVGTLVISWRNSTKADAAKAAAEHAAETALATKHAAELAAEDSKRELVATKDGVFQVGKAIDGRLTELLAITRKAALDEGRIEGRAAAHAEGLAADALATATRAEPPPKAG